MQLLHEARIQASFNTNHLRDFIHGGSVHDITTSFFYTF